MRSSSEEKLLCLTEQIDIFVLLYQSIQNCLSLRKPSLTIVFKPSINLKINKLIYLHMHLHLFISKKKLFSPNLISGIDVYLKKIRKNVVYKSNHFSTRGQCWLLYRKYFNIACKSPLTAFDLMAS